jgi:hypothetical protein
MCEYWACWAQCLWALCLPGVAVTSGALGPGILVPGRSVLGVAATADAGCTGRALCLLGVLGVLGTQKHCTTSLVYI